MSTASDTAAATPNAAPRIVAVQWIGQWGGQIERQEFLEVPATLDIRAAEQAWFAKGGDSSGQSLPDFLIANHGAKAVKVENWPINYM